MTTGKHMESIRESIQDFEYLVMLRDALARAETANAPAATLDAARALRYRDYMIVALVLPEPLVRALRQTGDGRTPRGHAPNRIGSRPLANGVPGETHALQARYRNANRTVREGPGRREANQPRVRGFSRSHPWRCPL